LKTSIRWWSRLAFVAGVGLTTLIACSSDRSDGHGDEKRTGSLSLALQATAGSGSVYRLRDAFFQITDVRSGQAVQFLFSEDGLPQDTELRAMLDRGDYTVTLQPGWFLERVSGPTGGGTGGVGGTMGGFGGIFGGGAGKGGIPMGEAGAAAEPKSAQKKAPAPEPAGEAGAGEPIGGSGGSSSTAGSFSIGGGFPDFGGDGSVGGTFAGGSGPIGGTGGSSSSEIVDAHLVSNAVQFFSIFGGDDEFVNYQFKVGGEVIDFNKGKLHVSISVDDSEACQVPSDVTRPERVLLESNVDAVSQMNLSSAFKVLASNGGLMADPDRLYREIYDSYASADQAALPDAVHCGDEMTNGVPTLNGFPIDCNRAEAAHVNDMQSFFATAFVNRIDLAPANGAHCGQQRVIFANPSRGRAFMIMEAQIPNPSPELGIDGCRPLAQFWLDQNSEPDAKVRGARLAQAFLFGGVQGLAEFGFGPFFTAENLTVGSGQIRTNQFDSFPWTLREFKLALDGSSLTALPFPTAESPNGALWNEDAGLSQGDACRQSFLTALDGVLTDNLSQMSFVVDAACKDAESRNDFSEDYASQMSPGFSSLIEEKLLSVGSSLSATDVANRARFSGSCMGCHNEASGSFLGNNVFAPFSDDFPQVQESASSCRDGETGQCFRTSNALNTVFLPARLLVMSNLLGVPIVSNPCSGGGGGTAGGGNNGFGGSFGMGGGVTAGTSSTGGASSGGGMIPLPLPPGSSEPAPVVEIELPPADEPVAEMQETEQEIREEYGDVTISGKSAKSTH
jgi:hypothetical protein